MRAPYHKNAAASSFALSCAILWASVSHITDPRTPGWYLSLLASLLLQALLWTIVYRLALHPLSAYPGSVIAACTDLWSVYWIISGDRHLELHRQHKELGKFVRYGPNRMSINSAKASKELHHVNANTCLSDTYGSFKEFFGSETSMTTLDEKLHGFRRRINMAALTPKAAKGLGPRIVPHVDILIDTLKKEAGSKDSARDDPSGWGSPRDMEYLVKYCIADIMADMTFSYHFNTQQDEKYRPFVDGFPKGVAGIHLTGHILWIFRYGLHKVIFGQLVSGIKQLQKVSDLFAYTRAHDGIDPSKGVDIWEALLGARDPGTGEAYAYEELRSEAGLFISAGTDTVVTAMTAVLFYLVHNPTVLEKLTREVRTAFPQDATGGSGIEFAESNLQQLTYVYACIDETLRLSPPIPCILPRRARKGGIVIEGEFFPEETNIGVPHYSLHRNEEYFPNPLAYEPERWIPNEASPAVDASNQMKAGVGLATSYTPFGAGRYSCIGRHLAYQEMTYILARLVWLFDMRIAPGSRLGEGTGTGLEGRAKKDEYQLYEGFVCEQHGPVVQFRVREDFRGST